MFQGYHFNFTDMCTICKNDKLIIVISMHISCIYFSTSGKALDRNNDNKLQYDC